MQGTSSLENTIFCNILFFVVAIATIKGQELYYVGWKDLRAIFWPNILFGKVNDTGWWGSSGRYETLAILNVSYYPCAVTYVRCQILLQQFSLGTRPCTQKSNANYVSTLENGPAMAEPAGPVPAPMLVAMLPLAVAQTLSPHFLLGSGCLFY